MRRTLLFFVSLGMVAGGAYCLLYLFLYAAGFKFWMAVAAGFMLWLGLYCLWDDFISPALKSRERR